MVHDSRILANANARKPVRFSLYAESRPGAAVVEAR